MFRKHPLDRAAQQRRIVARHRGDNQQRLPSFRVDLTEALQLPERLAQHHILVDRDQLLADRNLDDAEFRLTARRGGVGEHIQPGCDQRPHRRISERVGRIVEPSGAEARQLARPGQQRALHLIGVIKHQNSLGSFSTDDQCGTAFAHPQAKLLRRSRRNAAIEAMRTHC